LGLHGKRSYPETWSVGGKPEELVGAEWYFLTPQERWRESSQLWETYLALGGSLEPEPDTQSPFFDAEEWRARIC
jgi:hypothetical protein